MKLTREIILDAIAKMPVGKRAYWTNEDEKHVYPEMEYCGEKYILVSRPELDTCSVDAVYPWFNAFAVKIGDPVDPEYDCVPVYDVCWFIDTEDERNSWLKAEMEWNHSIEQIMREVVANKVYTEWGNPYEIKPFDYQSGFDIKNGKL